MPSVIICLAELSSLAPSLIPYNSQFEWSWCFFPFFIVKTLTLPFKSRKLKEKISKTQICDSTYLFFAVGEIQWLCSHLLSAFWWKNIKLVGDFMWPFLPHLFLLEFFLSPCWLYALLCRPEGGWLRTQTIFTHSWISVLSLKWRDWSKWFEYSYNSNTTRPWYFHRIETHRISELKI